MSYTITVLETASIQNYIFNSNELRDNVGASELAYRALTHWVQDELTKVLGSKQQHNYHLVNANGDIAQNPYRKGFDIFTRSDELPAAEVIYAGGGNAIILFKEVGETDKPLPQHFIKQLNLRILSQAPGLSLFANHQKYDPTAGVKLAKRVQEAIQKTKQTRIEHPSSMPTLGVSVTAACASTGLPATSFRNDDVSDKQGALQSSQTASKRGSKKKIQIKTWTDNRLRSMFPFVGQGIDWSDQLDEIAGSDGEESYIAIVHADGNGIGQAIIDQAQSYLHTTVKDEPRTYIEDMRRLSLKVNNTAKDALQRTIEAFWQEDDAIDWDNKKFRFRPIVFGGDDVTFVCPGRWGIALAHRYMIELEKEQITVQSHKNGIIVEDVRKPFASAGVAIIKTHYPFARAYQLSEELIKSAKKFALGINKKQISSIDWHVSMTGLTGSLKQIREREFNVSQDQSLHARPYVINPDNPDQQTWRTWGNFVLLGKFFESSWTNSRNKTIALREAVRGGRDTVAQFETLYRLNPPLITTLENATVQNGWIDAENAQSKQRCAYFDAIEVADQFLSLLPTATSKGVTP